MLFFWIHHSPEFAIDFTVNMLYRFTVSLAYLKLFKGEDTEHCITLFMLNQFFRNMSM